ncbi:MAG: hypothetical protein LC791_12090 [Acidobacteria bacterium]|nr:hypothetical protein [Acidobacteriota bacterium]
MSSALECPVYVRVYQDGSSTRLERIAGRWRLTSTDAEGSVECRYHLSGMLAAVQRSVDAMVKRPAKTAWILMSD